MMDENEADYCDDYGADMADMDFGEEESEEL